MLDEEKKEVIVARFQREMVKICDDFYMASKNANLTVSEAVSLHFSTVFDVALSYYLTACIDSSNGTVELDKEKFLDVVERQLEFKLQGTIQRLSSLKDEFPLQ